MTSRPDIAVTKVPEITVGFWVLKVLATTLGETGGDAVTMSMGLGYLVGTGIFAAIFGLVIVAQVRARRFHPSLYWTAIVATTTVGTTLADLADRSLGIGYAGGSALLLALLLGSFWTWHRTLGTVAVDSVHSPRAETFYWVTIMFSQTLGTALGDWAADTAGLGYLGAALVFGALLALTALLCLTTRVSRTVLFWTAFILTRPLGAALGDVMDKPLGAGGLAMDRYEASAALLVAMVAGALVFRQRAATSAH